MLSETTRALIVDVLNGDTTGVSAFIKRAKTKLARELAAHLDSYVMLVARYEELPDDQTASVVDAMAVHEDWFEAQLGWAT